MKEWLIKILLTGLSLLAPIHAMIITVTLLIIIDMITGIWAAIKRGEKINSADMRRTISKFFIYQIVIVGGFCIETWLIGGLFPVSKLIAGVIGMVELKSLLENANVILGIDIFKELLNKLDSKNNIK